MTGQAMKTWVQRHFRSSSLASSIGLGGGKGEGKSGPSPSQTPPSSSPPSTAISTPTSKENTKETPTGNDNDVAEVEVVEANGIAEKGNAKKEEGPPPRVVILWVVPRSTSTMFEIAFLQPPISHSFRSVLHEPMGEAYYHGPEVMSKRFEELNKRGLSGRGGDEDEERGENIWKDETILKAWSNVLNPPSSPSNNTSPSLDSEPNSNSNSNPTTPTSPASAPPSRIFSKDMAYYLIPPPEGLMLDPSSEAKESIDQQRERIYPFLNADKSRPIEDQVLPESIDNSSLATNNDNTNDNDKKTKKENNLPPNPTIIPSSSLLSSEICHTFLIRTPEKAIPSFWKLTVEGDLKKGKETGFEYFDPLEAGYRELRLLYEYISAHNSNLGKEKPLIIDSSDLLSNPEMVMKEYCKRVGVEFDKRMLEWESGGDGKNGEGAKVMRDHFAKWPGFHSTAEGSSGIGKPPSPQPQSDQQVTNSASEEGSQSQKEEKSEEEEKEEKKKNDRLKEEVPEVVRKTIEAATEDYNWLRERRFVPTLSN